MSHEIKSVGVIGLGKMGAPIARHLMRGGFRVFGLDVSREANEQAKAAGVTISADPADMAGSCDLVIVLTAYEDQVEDVLFGEQGIAANGKAGLIVGVAATINPNAMRDFAARLAEHDIITLDIPLCRGEIPAEKGTLLITGGGDKAAFDACRPAFATFATSVHWLGEAGAGQVGKMVNNLILWACVSANTEGFKLAAKYGVRLEAMKQMLGESSAQNFALDMPDEDRMPWAEKDMMIVLSEADRLRLTLPLCGSVKEIIKGIKIETGRG